ncbi:MAG: DoxX family protein [Myxococcota bacterium]
MKTRKIGYFVATGLVAFAFAAGGIFDLLRAPAVVEGMTQLGYPAYVASLLGIWKVLGAVAVVVPRFPRLKEWAYAGMFFDLTGAAFSHVAAGDPAGKLVAPLVLLALVLASWTLRPEARTFKSREEAAPAGRFQGAVVAS